ncbi:hypothetical protein M0R45_019432 [Rubus argutus]|uniref:Uncharacterized protein n=1 Tax=Rubus argutus TaxID=59490 RepID=A0AAW1X6Z9_RUBAR
MAWVSLIAAAAQLFGGWADWIDGGRAAVVWKSGQQHGHGSRERRRRDGLGTDCLRNGAAVLVHLFVSVCDIGAEKVRPVMRLNLMVRMAGDGELVIIAVRALCTGIFEMVEELLVCLAELGLMDGEFELEKKGSELGLCRNDVRR